MAGIESLVATAARDLAARTTALLTGHLTAAQWERAMIRSLSDAHTAAFVAGTAQRLGVSAGSQLVRARALSAAERAEIHAAVAEQRRYLARFAQAVAEGGLTDAQIRARATSYADSIRATESRAATWGADLPFYPADGGTECLTHCRCRWQRRGALWYWVLDAAAEHCDGCRVRADANPYAG